MATRRTAAIGKLTSATKAPRSTARPPSSSTSMVDHAMKCDAGTPIACRMSANASGPLDSLAKPCAMKPYPTINRSGIGDQCAIGNLLDNSSFLLLIIEQLAVGAVALALKLIKGDEA